MFPRQYHPRTRFELVALYVAVASLAVFNTEHRLHLHVTGFYPESVFESLQLCDLGKSEFSVDDNAALEQMVQGRFLQAEVVGRESNGIPYINLYLFENNQVRVRL